MYRLPPSAQKVIDLYESFDWYNTVQLPVKNISLTSSRISVLNEDVVSFGNSSYLGLHKDERVIEAGVEEMRKNGVVYSSSRSYTYSNTHDEFEDLLSKIFGKPTLAAIQTTMADFGAMPLLMLPTDVILMDMMAHATLQNVALIPKALGATMDRVNHIDMDHLESKIKYYRSKEGVEKIWYVCDGVYSMYGDTTPILDLLTLLERYDNFYVYIDDAHGMSWAGPNGAGYVFKYIPNGHPKVVMATSLGKGFGIGGGALICPNEIVKDWVKKVGLNNVFCTQLPNQMLGSGIAVAKIHLSNEIYLLQDKIKENIDYFIEKSRMLKLNVVKLSETPVFYLALPGEESFQFATALNKLLRSNGYYANLGSYPAVSIKNCGLRVSLTSCHTKREIEGVLNTIVLGIEALSKSFKVNKISNDALEVQA